MLAVVADGSASPATHREPPENAVLVPVLLALLWQAVEYVPARWKVVALNPRSAKFAIVLACYADLQSIVGAVQPQLSSSDPALCGQLTLIIRHCPCLPASGAWVVVRS